uniref:Structural polyprotein n=1 Tax=Ndumu virus TaxID=59302 RepID=Q80S25_9VIRU|nr:structural polyprotein precursor [Ndumu virus]
MDFFRGPFAMPFRQPYRRPFAMPPRPRPRFNPVVEQGRQIQQLIQAVGSLALAQRPRAQPSRPPRQNRRRKPQQPTQSQQKSKKQKPKSNQKNAQVQTKKQDKTKKKPGKRERKCMKIESDCIFEVKLDGEVTGYACLVGDKVMKPAHVKGVIQNDELAKLSFKKSSKYDLECAQIPVKMRSDASKYTHEKPEGHYNWHHGAVQYTNGRFTIPTGAGKPGDSGRPIFDNKGRVVAIVLGGANEGARTALSVVTWNKDMVTRVTPEGSVEWSAAATCVLGAAIFSCLSPPVCYDEEPEKTLTMLSMNVDNPDYYSLFEAALDCRSRRHRRAAQHFNEYKVTQPYIAYCPDCGNGESCQSPVAIERIRNEATDGTLKVQFALQVGIKKDHSTAPTYLRYMEGHEVKDALNNLRVYTSAQCEVTATMGHFALARCPPGDSLSVTFMDASKKNRMCRVPFVHKLPFLGREKNSARRYHGKDVTCTTYARRTDVTDENLEMHVPPHIPDATLVKVQLNNVTITPPSGATVRYNCSCKDGNRQSETSREVVLSGCAEAKCHAAVVDGKVWQYSSRFVPRHEKTELKGKVHVPFPLTNTTCRVSVATKPIEKHARGLLTLVLHPEYPTLLSYRYLGAEPRPVNRWISEPTEVQIPVSKEGIEYRWGNNEPERRWAQHTTTGSAHGHPHEIITYYYHSHPTTTVVACVTAAAVTLVMMCVGCSACRVARTRCLTPYVLAPGSRVPLILGLLCCAKGARAEQYEPTPWWVWAPAALVLLCGLRKCLCLTFLVILGLASPPTQAYEHTAVMSNQVGVPYKALINKPGFAPMILQIEVLQSSLIPSLELDYITCEYKTVVPSPFVKCCGSVECTGRSMPDYQCRVDSGVYPYMWGGAYCFCSSENTQMSEAYVERAEVCKHEHALAYKTQTASLTATLKVTLGNITQGAKAYVNGETPFQIGQAKFVLGPISAAWSPFNPKIVVYKDDVYNYDFPAYGAGQPGRFGDIQSRTVDSKDLYARTHLRLDRPASGNIHVPYTQIPSGFKYWMQEKGEPLNRQAAFGCVVKTNPVRADNCAYGNIPISVDIPDAMFTRVVDIPAVSHLQCIDVSCAHSAGFGGVAKLRFMADRTGKCAIHTASKIVAIQEATVDLPEIAVGAGGGTAEITFHYSTALASPSFDVQLCSAHVTCDTKCEPPKDHIVPFAAQHMSNDMPNLSATAMNWVTGLGTSIGTFVFLFLGILLVVTIIRCFTR